MNTLNLTEIDIANVLENRYTYIDKIDAIRYIKRTFGSTATLKEISRAYDSIEWNSKEY